MAIQTKKEQKEAKAAKVIADAAAKVAKAEAKAEAKAAKEAAVAADKAYTIEVTRVYKEGIFTKYDIQAAFDIIKASNSTKVIRDKAIKAQKLAERKFKKAEAIEAIKAISSNKEQRIARDSAVSVIVSDDHSLDFVKIDSSRKEVIANFKNYGDRDIEVDYDTITDHVSSSILDATTILSTEIFKAYTIANLPVYIKHAIQSALKVIGNSENGYNVYQPTILKAVSDSLIQIELLHRIGEELDGDLKEIDKVEKAYNSIFAKAKASYLTAKLASIQGIEADKDANGYAVVKSPISQAAGTKLASIILNSFVTVQDFVTLTESINKKGDTQVSYTINREVMAGAIDKVINEGSSLRSQAIFIDTPPTIDADFSIGNKFDLIGDKVSMVVGGSENSYGDTSVIVESLNNLTKTELVIDQDFLDINLEITQKLIEIANRK